MDTKKYKTILTKDGYLLNKKRFTKKELDTVMNELTVEPQLSYSVGIKNKLEKTILEIEKGADFVYHNLRINYTNEKINFSSVISLDLLIADFKLFAD